MSWLPVNLRNSLGRKPSRFVSSPERLPWSSQTSQRGPKLYKLPSPEVSQAFLSSSTQPVAIRRQFPSSKASTWLSSCWRLRGLWLGCAKLGDYSPCLLRWLDERPGLLCALSAKWRNGVVTQLNANTSPQCCTGLLFLDAPTCAVAISWE